MPPSTPRTAVRWPSLDHVQLAARLTAYALLSLVVVELWSATATGFDVYRPLDLSLLSATSFLGLALVMYLVLRLAFSTASEWLQTNKSAQTWWLLLALVVGGCGLYSSCPTQLPGWSAAAMVAAMLGLQWTLSEVASTVVGNLVARTFFGSIVLALSLFGVQELGNAHRHERYARALATPEDARAERAIAKLGRDYRLDQERLDPASYWEHAWRGDDYLASNYFFSFEQDSTRGIFAGSQELSALQTTLGYDSTRTPEYRVKTPLGHTILLTLNSDFRHSAYSAGLAYKDLQQLERYHYVVVDAGQIILANATSFNLAALDLKLPKIGSFGTVAGDVFEGTVYRHDADTYVLIGEPQAELQLLFTLFAFALCVMLTVAGVVEALQRVQQWQHVGAHWRQLALQHKMPVVLLGSTLVLFGVVAVATFLFLLQNNATSTYERQLSLARSVRTDLHTLLERDALPQGQNPKHLTPPALRTLFERRLVDIDVYGASGSLLSTSFASRINALAPAQLSSDVQDAFATNPFSILVRYGREGNRDFVRTYFGVTEGTRLVHVVGLNTPLKEAGTAQDIPVIMGKLLVVYVGLLLLAWVCGLVLIRMLMGPLLTLASRMQTFELGDAQEPLVWTGNDGVGKLISAYNDMLRKLEASTAALVERERDGAWQVMALQIAHEINNTLTPLRLNSEYINMVLTRSGNPDLDGARRMAHGMLERIDHLSQVASQFKILAQLDTPSLTETCIAPLLREYITTRQPQINSRISFVAGLEAGRALSLIDPHHLLQVINNLLVNADRAIEGRLGQITVTLEAQDQRIWIKIRDNGSGIPAHVQATIFNPKFSTTSSQTGLGLPVSRRIVEYFGGTLSFETREGVGTTILIDLPAVGMLEAVQGV